MNKLLVFQSDFGLVDGAVSAMHGVANTVDDSIKIQDLTHDIPPIQYMGCILPPFSDN